MICVKARNSASLSSAVGSFTPRALASAVLSVKKPFVQKWKWTGGKVGVGKKLPS